MKGKLESIEEIRLLKEGFNKKGKAWKLFGSNITVDSQKYGVTSFSQSDLQAKLSGILPGDTVEFEAEQSGNFTNIKQDSEIKIVSKGTGIPQEPPKQAKQEPEAKKPTIPFMNDEEIFSLMGKCIEAVKNSLKEKKLAVESLAEMTTMINSVFIACREERKAQRRWE